MSYFTIVNERGAKNNMEIQTISQVSKSFNISTRTLRYYEQIGLIKSEKINDYAYRTRIA